MKLFTSVLTALAVLAGHAVAASELESMLAAYPTCAVREIIDHDFTWRLVR